MDFADYRSKRLSRPSTGANMEDMTLDQHVAYTVTKMLNGATAFHMLHLKVKGPGSYAAHKALQELYEGLPGHADALAEGFQGATEMLLTYQESSPKILNSVEEAVSYIRELYKCAADLQLKLPYTEIVNDLDNVKSLLNSVKYKLVFLS